MKQFTSEEVQARFERLPPEIQEAVTSTDVHERIRSIGQKHDLRVDQIGALVDEIGLVMLGFQKSSSFIPDLMKELNIPRKQAEEIVEDVNTEIFTAIRSQLREMEQAQEEAEQSREEDGGSPVQPIPVSEQESLRAATIPHVERMGNMEILPHDEPEPEIATPASAQNEYVEPLIDYLLENPVAHKEQKVPIDPPANLPTDRTDKTSRPSYEPTTNPDKQEPDLQDSIMPKIPEVPPAAPTQPKAQQRSGPDPYREPIE